MVVEVAEVAEVAAPGLQGVAVTLEGSVRKSTGTEMLSLCAGDGAVVKEVHGVADTGGMLEGRMPISESECREVVSAGVVVIDAFNDGMTILGKTGTCRTPGC
jgi:hypothetical protein